MINKDLNNQEKIIADNKNKFFKFISDYFKDFNLTKLVEIVGCTIGIIGTIMLSLFSSNGIFRFIVFDMYIVSNVCLIIFSIKKKAYFLLFMNIIYSITSIIGIINNVSYLFSK